MAVTGINRNAQCIVHHDRPAAARCGTCHRPICSECVVSVGAGKFCSHECAQKAEDFRKRFRTVKQGKSIFARLVGTVVWVAIVVALLGIVNKYVTPIPVLKPYLDKLPFLGAQKNNTSNAPNAPAPPQTPNAPAAPNAPGNPKTPTAPAPSNLPL